jgi:hypothetical protein
MGKLTILAPTPIAAIAANRGGDVALLLTPDPKEVWYDTAVGVSAAIDLDLGGPMPIDTIFVGSISGAVAGAAWSIQGGLASPTDTLIQTDAPLRVPDAAGQAPAISHSLWTGAERSLRYIRLNVGQPVGFAPLTAGIVMVGKAFAATLGHEWGAGRKVIDTGTSTALPGGGFAVVEGARKGSYSWTFGDLSPAEVDALYALQLDRGETRPLLVVEDPAATAGLRWRLHYGKLTALRQFERRNPAQTRWEMTVEEWI